MRSQISGIQHALNIHVDECEIRFRRGTILIRPLGLKDITPLSRAGIGKHKIQTAMSVMNFVECRSQFLVLADAGFSEVDAGRLSLDCFAATFFV